MSEIDFNSALFTGATRLAAEDEQDRLAMKQSEAAAEFDVDSAFDSYEAE